MPDDTAPSKKIADYSDRLKTINEKMEKLKAQRESILLREKEKARKARTRRLIQNGALAEQYLQCEDMAPELFEKFLSRLVSQPGFPNFVHSFKNISAEKKDKLESQKLRQSFSKYKAAAAGSPERESARRQYLGDAGVHPDWTSPGEIKP